MIRFAALILLLCGCATPQTKDHVEEGQVMNPRRKGDPEPVFQFEPGPALADTAALKAWLEANRGARLRLPVVIELGEPGHGFKRVRIGEFEVRVTDLALGIPLRSGVRGVPR